MEEERKVEFLRKNWISRKHLYICHYCYDDDEESSVWCRM